MLARILARRTAAAALVPRAACARMLHSSAVGQNISKKTIPDPKQVQSSWEKPDKIMPVNVTEHQLVHRKRQSCSVVIVMLTSLLVTGNAHPPTERVMLENVSDLMTKNDILHLVQRSQTPKDDVESSKRIEALLAPLTDLLIISCI